MDISTAGRQSAVCYKKGWNKWEIDHRVSEFRIEREPCKTGKLERPTIKQISDQFAWLAKAAQVKEKRRER